MGGPCCAERDVIMLLLEPMWPKNPSVQDNPHFTPVTSSKICICDIEMDSIILKYYSAGFNIKSSLNLLYMVEI